MDGKILKPIGKAGVSGNYGRFNSPDATQGRWNQYANARGRRDAYRRAETRCRRSWSSRCR